MARRISESVGYKVSETKPTVKSEKPKKLSKAGEWMRTHPHGVGGVIYCDMRALMK